MSLGAPLLPLPSPLGGGGSRSEAEACLAEASVGSVTRCCAPGPPPRFVAPRTPLPVTVGFPASRPLAKPSEAAMRERFRRAVPPQRPPSAAAHSWQRRGSCASCSLLPLGAGRPPANVAAAPPCKRPGPGGMRLLHSLHAPPCCKRSPLGWRGPPPPRGMPAPAAVAAPGTTPRDRRGRAGKARQRPWLVAFPL